MILYLDTSAFIKLYIVEEGRKEVLRAARIAESVASNEIAYVEMRAALARLARTNRLESGRLARVKKAFEEDWTGTLRVLPDEPMVKRSGDLAERFGLRGYDSLHLAAAERLMSESAWEVRFACFDRALGRAAHALGLGALSAV